MFVVATATATTEAASTTTTTTATAQTAAAAASEGTPGTVIAFITNSICSSHYVRWPPSSLPCCQPYNQSFTRNYIRLHLLNFFAITNATLEVARVSSWRITSV